MNSNNTIHWGILGCGKIASKFAKDLTTIPNAKLQAVSSRSIQKAKEFASNYNASLYYEGYEKLSKDPKIDVIYIATPHVFHFENTMMCLQNKKAVLCEKPFAMKISQVQEMIQTAEENNVFLMEALWTYFLPHYRFVLDSISSGKLGAIKSLQADFGFAAQFDSNSRLFNKNLGGGSLLDIGIYPLFAALSIIGYPETVMATAQIGKTGVDETCTIKLGYKNGVTASLLSTITKDTETEAIITLEKGIIKINKPFHAPSYVTITKENQSNTHTFGVTTNGYNFEAIHVQ